MPTQARLSTPALAGAAIAIGLLVVGGILLIGRLGTTEAVPTPSTQVITTPAPTTTPADPSSTPEGAVRAFFAALKEARRTDDATVVRPYVTDEQSAAYLSVQGFVASQKEANKASVLTIQQLDNIRVEVTGDTATVRLTYTEGGYDISLDDGQPLESPGTLAPRDATLQLRQVDGRWLVASYEARLQ